MLMEPSIFHAQVKAAHKILCSRLWSLNTLCSRKWSNQNLLFLNNILGEVSIKHELRQRIIKQGHKAITKNYLRTGAASTIFSVSTFALSFFVSAIPKVLWPSISVKTSLWLDEKQDKWMKWNIWQLDDCLKVICEVQNKFWNYFGYLVVPPKPTLYNAALKLRIKHHICQHKLWWW